jgi:CubicO group peptidase (beta-lactamase class C family)
LPADLTFYTGPLQSTGTTNPLLAGGLRASMNDYARILRFVYDKGVWQGAPLLAPGIFDLQTIVPYPNAVIGGTPAQNRNVRYGLTAWLECSTPDTGCASISSPGAYGFTPWLDREHGYYAVLGMEYPQNSATGFGSAVEAQLKPLIVEALDQL